MSEQIEEKRVLALKYRPHRFEDLVGQSTVSQTLSLALDSNRLSHAYLFSGLRGSGKTSTARIMAKALLCSNGPTSKPCEICDNCKSANASRHLDIIEMDAASNRGIDDIKDLIEHTKYKPSSARFKVFIIDEVHMLTTQAFNALLKTLEEPPGFVKFILATTDPLKLPATILSRTQHFRFNKIAQRDVIHHLSHILNEENIEYEKEALEILSRSGQGSLRDTLTLLDQAIIFSKGSVTTIAVVDMLGLIDPKLMDDIFDIILNKGDIRNIVKSLENYDVSQVCDEISIYLKQKMLDKDAKFDLLLFDRFFRIISDAKQLLSINSDGGFVLILTLMKMLEATNIKTIDELINQVQKIEATQEEISVKTIAVKEDLQKVVEQKQEETHAIDSLADEVKAFAKKEEIQTPVIEEKIIEKIEEPSLNYLNPFDEEFSEETKEENFPKELIDTNETKIEKLNASDEIMLNTMNIHSLDAVETINVPDFDSLSEQKTEEKKIENNSLKIIENEKKEQTLDIEKQVSYNPNEEIEVVPFEEPEIIEEASNEQYEALTAKVYDRDYSLGECFEKNFIFKAFENNKLSIISYAQDEDRKFLYKHFAMIRTFALDVFGQDVELDFTKGQREIEDSIKDLP